MRDLLTYFPGNISRFRRGCIFALWIVSFSVMFSAQAAIPLMPLTEVPVGAHGVARTVIAGTRIEEFGVEIPDDAAETIQTVGDAVKFLEKNSA